jgi:hypothetical protein
MIGACSPGPGHGGIVGGHVEGAEDSGVILRQNAAAANIKIANAGKGCCEGAVTDATEVGIELVDQISDG